MALTVAIILSGALAGIPGHFWQTGIEIDGSISTCIVTEAEGHAVPTLVSITPAPPSEGYRADQLWVDRAHQNAIAEECTICGSGDAILASWYLNNPRLSRYVTCGGGTPLWVYPASTAGGSVDISSGDSPIWGGANAAMGTAVWLSGGSQPSFVLEGGSKQDISDDGSRLVYVNSLNHLVCVDTATQGVLWDVPLVTVGNGVYGVDICGNATRVLVSAYDASTGAQVYNMSNGALVGSAVGNYGQTKGWMDYSGNRFVLGDFNARIKCYQWSGSAWTLAGNLVAGDSWVTAVAISADGLTAAGGTLGFSPYRGRVVAVDWPSGGSPASMWQYNAYGDEVSSLAICDDGSVIVAGSWGTYGATSGDVFTAFDHDGGIIFRLLDDIDEPGSIFSVDVSADGSYATASGKAVHARLMGNGGEVYGIQIMDTQQHDVGVIAIVSPVENQQVGNVVIPQVTVANLGLAAESFNVSAVIETAGGTPVWTGSASVASLAPGGTANVSFSTWTVPSFGSWNFRAQTLLAGDTYPQNDTLQASVRAYHDAEAMSIEAPYELNTIGMALSPAVMVRNGGTYTESMQVTMTIDGPGGQVYNQTVGSAALAPGATAVVTLPSWTPSQTGSYTADASVTVADDFVPDNDEKTLPFEVTYEIIYEDGSWESYYWVGSLQDDMFATRFTPTVSTPYTVTQFRVFVNSVEPFSWGMLCFDNGSGLPDVANPLFQVDNVSAPSSPGWLVVPINVWIDTPGDLWFVTHWPDTDVLGVGTDTEQPRHNRSWWHNTSSGWVNFTSGDWSFRLTVEPETGLEGGGAVEFLSMGLPTPNPFTGAVSIPVSIPSTGAIARVSVYDITGRCVRVVHEGGLAAGLQSIAWDGCSTDGAPVPSGIYFARLEAPGMGLSRKMVLIR